LAFNSTPSQLHRTIFWDITYDDLKTKAKLYIGEKQALITQQFQTFFKVAELALGEGEKGEDPNVNMMKPKSAEELKNAMAKVFG
jgi:hypothetical protein